ncbi:peptidase [Nitrosopumilus zosterae]|uniref:peptidase n=1 Tax=Nitrosopumilus zosterae TaxID=718286 RepID=UPI002207C9F9|nr:peptidase [Nitrosopumilus zosterae]BDQ31442.1 peptidase [Nitrosopumilus zosterae]
MNILVIGLLTILLGVGFSNISYGQGVQTAGGVDVEGTWYLGEGLKVGDYFEYSLCEIDLNDCAPIKLKMWIKGEIQNESESLWDTKVVVIDGNKIIQGSMGLGKTAPEPVLFDDDLFDYAIGFKSSLAWLSAFATANEDDRIHGPQKFSDAAWGKIGAIGGAQLIPKRTETINTPAGTADTVVVGWYSGNNNEIWILDDFPFPVKALTYAWVTTGIAPIMYQYTLLDYKENITDDPFKDVKSTIPKEKLLECPTEFHNYVSGRESTNTFSMLIQYNYSPEVPIEGCSIDWKINFMNKYNEVEFIDQVHYDIWVVDDAGNKIRSYAQDIGRADLFNGFGQVHILLPVEEKAGIVKYAIFVHGTGSEYEVPNPELGGYVIVEIEIAENLLLRELDNDMSYPEIPSWIKNNAGWWAAGQIGDDSFIQGIQFLIKENIMKIPSDTQDSSSVSNEIPSWIKNNAGWWAAGQIGDDSFIQGIQFLIKENIIKIT